MKGLCGAQGEKKPPSSREDCGSSLPASPALPVLRAEPLAACPAPGPPHGPRAAAKTAASSCPPLRYRARSQRSGLSIFSTGLRRAAASAAGSDPTSRPPQQLGVAAGSRASRRRGRSLRFPPLPVTPPGPARLPRRSSLSVPAAAYDGVPSSSAASPSVPALSGRWPRGAVRAEAAGSPVPVTTVPVGCGTRRSPAAKLAAPLGKPT